MDESKFYAYCLQGDVTAACEYLHALTNKSEQEKDLEEKYDQRFFSRKPIISFKTQDQWIHNILSAYHQYFTLVLTRYPREDAEIQLIQALQSFIPSSETNLDNLEEALEAIFKEKGYSFLGGVTPPFRGPYIWKTTEKQTFHVELPNHSQDVTVYFLSDFIMQSWIHFATFGEKVVGGWAKPEGLYYVAELPEKKKVSLDSSEFQVSYLKHEAQHLSDFERFPHLSAKDLEYRAKLVELIYEPNSSRLLEKFYYEKKNDPKLPHPYSSYCLMKNISKLAFSTNDPPNLADWLKLESVSIQAWARTLYDAHTAQLEIPQLILKKGN